MIVIYKDNDQLKIGEMTKEEVISFAKNMALLDEEYCIIDGIILKNFNQKLVVLNGTLTSHNHRSKKAPGTPALDDSKIFTRDILKGAK